MNESNTICYFQWGLMVLVTPVNGMGSAVSLFLNVDLNISPPLMRWYVYVRKTTLTSMENAFQVWKYFIATIRIVYM